jgi:DHA1 family bicyclomycin/chloramphenicol resistance-like MFS transporter
MSRKPNYGLNNTGPICIASGRAKKTAWNKFTPTLDLYPEAAYKTLQGSRFGWFRPLVSDCCFMPLLKRDTLAMTAVLALMTALGPLSTDLYLPSLPSIATDFTASIAAAQTTLSAFLFGFALGQIFHGPLSDRLGRRPVLLAGFLLFILASFACAYAPSMDWLIAGRFLQAVGASGPIVLGRAIARDLYEGARAGRELSRMGTVMGLVPAIAPIIGGVIETAYGWRFTFTAMLVFGLVIGLIALIGLPETLPSRSAHPLSLRAMIGDYKVLLRNQRYRFYISLSTLSYGGLFAFISGSSFVLQTQYGLDALTFGKAFGLVVIGFISGTLLAARLVTRIGIDRTIGHGTTALALGGISMGLAFLVLDPSPLILIGPMMVYTLGVGLVMPQSTAGALSPFPEKAGAASSMLGLTQMIFAASTGLLLGHMLDWGVWPLPLLIAGLGVAALGRFRFTQF